MTETIKTCPDCGENLTEQRWERASDHKKFHAWRHEVKGDCKYIEWLNEPKVSKRGQIQRNIAPKGEDYQNLLAANRKLYSLILAIAHLQGVKSEDIDNELERMKYQK